VHEYNLAAYELWSLVAGQWNWRQRENGGSVPVGLNLPAIESALRIADIDQSEWPTVALQLTRLGEMVLSWASA